jgi:hypothetical protein
VTPTYRHDCKSCVFLGRHNGQDLYFCEQGGSIPTVVARFGDEGSEYTSSMEMVEHYPELKAALRLAIERGLVRRSA